MYSPTQTMTWLKCPSYWYFKRHYEPIKIWAPYKAMGSAIHKGLAGMLSGMDYDSCLHQAGEILYSEYQPYEEWPWEPLIKLLDKTLKNLAKSDVIKAIRSSETIIATEMKLKGSGSDSYLDLLTERDGKWIVTDYKTKWKLDSKYVTRTLVESATDWQLYHYAREVFNKYNEIPIIRHILIVLNPRTQVFSHETQLTEEKLRNWFIGAKWIWADIKDAQDSCFGNLSMNLTQCYDRYGKCEAYDLCHTMEKDETRALTLYKKLDR